MNVNIKFFILCFLVLLYFSAQAGPVETDEVNVVTQANAGSDTTICSSTYTLKGNTPSPSETGIWTIIEGTGTFANANNPGTTVSNLSEGVTTIEWKITKGSEVSRDTVILTNNSPTIAHAGIDQNVCEGFTVLAANNPSQGAGNWSVLSGTGYFANTSLPDSDVTGLSEGENLFIWTVSYGGCPDTKDTVLIRNNKPSQAFAGTDQNVCEEFTTLAAANPSNGTGTWSVYTGNGSFANPSLNISEVTGINEGENSFIWTVASSGCPESKDTVLVRSNKPTEALAGAEQNVCQNFTSLAANTPSQGTGNWSVLSGTGSFADASLPDSEVTELSEGENLFIWTISYGGCPDSKDTVLIHNNKPSQAFAGDNQNVCEDFTTLAAANPSNGTGTWSVYTGNGSFANPSLANSEVTEINEGDNSFIWTVSSAGCPDSKDTVVIRNNKAGQAFAGLDQNICDDYTTLAASSPSQGTGNWFVLSGTGSFTDASLPYSDVNGLSEGENLFIWSISYGGCPDSKDTVLIRNNKPSQSFAGPDQNVCEDFTTLAAANPSNGTGTWSVYTGNGSFADPSLANSGATVLDEGENRFIWTVSSGGCGESKDTVLIRNNKPTKSQTGADQNLCTDFVTLIANSPTQGTGTWSVYTGAGYFDDASLPLTEVTGLNEGNNFFIWTISFAGCPDSKDTVLIRNNKPTKASAGSDQELCKDFTTLAANNPTQGTGTWSVYKGTGSFTNGSLANSDVKGLSEGENAFIWTISLNGCPDSKDTVLILNNKPTKANAGPDQELCATTATLSGNIPTQGTGSWVALSGYAILSDPFENITSVSGLKEGNNYFVWTVSYGSCTPSQDTVTINNKLPTAANAGIDQLNVCSTTTTVNGNTPTQGTGSWTVTSGSGTFNSATSPVTQITGLNEGENSFIWTISHGGCTPSRDTVKVFNNLPSKANAGNDQLFLCSTSSQLNGNIPGQGIGQWSLLSGTGTFSSATDPQAVVTSLAEKENKFIWTISNSNCPVSRDTVIIKNNLPTSAIAGYDQELCSTSTTLTANSPSQGTGSWSVFSGAGNFASVNDPNSVVSGLQEGKNLFIWTISNTNCLASRDTVEINNKLPSKSNAGPDQNNLCTTTASLNANIPTQGSGQWSVYSGTGVLSNASSPSSSISNLQEGINLLIWTITNSNCAASKDTIVLNNKLPTTSDAGPDQQLCNTLATLTANSPTQGTGTWSIYSGSGTFASSVDPNTTVADLQEGNNIFIWTISHPGCNASRDTVIINNKLPTKAIAGPDQLNLCSTSTTLSANQPSQGTGTWSVLQGNAVFENSTSPTSAVTNLLEKENKLIWTVVNTGCAPSKDTVTLTNNLPTQANAGPDQQICSNTVTLTANTPTQGSATWSVYSGSGTFTSSSDPNTNVTGLAEKDNIFIWTVSSSGCPSSRDTVIINNKLPTKANAGADQNNVCKTSTALSANKPSQGTGTWSLHSGTGTFANPNDNATTVSGLQEGLNLFIWTVANSGCAVSRDTVSVNNTLPSNAIAGPDQLSLCSTTATLSANSPTQGSGGWSLLSGSGTMAFPADPFTNVSGLAEGNNMFIWTIQNSNCPSSKDTVTVRNNLPTKSKAGPDQKLCSTSTIMAANTPTQGSGSWILISGGGTIATLTDAKTSFSNIPEGMNTFIWNISNNGCSDSKDTVIVWNNLPTAPLTGSNKVVCEDSVTISANVPTQGIGEWTVASGSGNIQSPGISKTLVLNLGRGTNLFRWTISYPEGGCAARTDDIEIVNNRPTAADAGADQNICSKTTSLAGNYPLLGTGQWSLISGQATFAEVNNGSTEVSNLKPGPNILEWKIIKENCSLADTVFITNEQPETISAGPDAKSGPDITTCLSNYQLDATNPVNEISTAKGKWTRIGGVFPGNDTLYNTNIILSSQGLYTFVWTISNKFCTPISDTLTVQRDLFAAADAGTDSVLLCQNDYVLNGIPAKEPGTGTWTVISGFAEIEDSSLATSLITNIGYGWNVLQWEVVSGSCVPGRDYVSIRRDSLPSLINAGSDTSICQNEIQLNGNDPKEEISTSKGVWEFIEGPDGEYPTFENDESPETKVAGIIIPGNYVFEYKITNGSCPSIQDQIIVTRDTTINSSYAGADVFLCGNAFTLQASPPESGTGQWTVITGNSQVMSEKLYNSAVINLDYGLNTFEWKVSNGTCIKRDTMNITAGEAVTPANAGKDTSLCDHDNTILVANLPFSGTGTWSSSGEAMVEEPAKNITSVTNLGGGENKFIWTIKKGFCTSTDTVTIKRYLNPPVADAGPDQEIFNSATSLHASSPDPGKGVWKIIKGTCTVYDSTDYHSMLNNIDMGEVILLWSVKNGICPVTTDTVSVTRRVFDLPNAFSPNGDDKNNTFEIQGIQEFAPAEITVFNRWGEIVYINSNYQNDWDGTNLNGQDLVDDTYYYSLKLNNNKVFNGFVILKR